jgi:bifunctional UDP-N-acetylglucosamine pyrophosphorylase / glucosamine-1-phosphate N-acetyltransferase
LILHPLFAIASLSQEQFGLRAWFMIADSPVCIVLAAGKGTRMRSRQPKVLHKVAHRSLLQHVLTAVEAVGSLEVVVVVGPDMPEVELEARPHRVVIQEQRRGTGHAVATARGVLDRNRAPVLVVYGDTPLVRAETLARLAAAVGPAPAPAVAVLGVPVAPSSAFGRLVFDDSGHLRRIVESADATPDERLLPLGNAGIMAIDGGRVDSLLNALRADNAQGEYYLTDVVGHAAAQGWTAVAEQAAPEEALGVNCRADLALIESELQNRLRAAAMAAGVTLSDPSTVWLCADTQLGEDVTVGQNVVFGPGVVVEAGAEILPFCHLEGAHIASGARVGPFARIRPGTSLGHDVHVGNFVELKNATLADGVKVGHLTYLGDADIGAQTNVGAGTITCNYDGYLKHRTHVGAGVFIGSDSALVAPVTVGDRAVIGAGSIVTQDTPADALVIARAAQVTLPGKGRLYHERKAAAKAARTKPATTTKTPGSE